MEFFHLTDTIAAIATPPGHGGIAIIRVCGPHAMQAVSSLAGQDIAMQASHTVRLCRLCSSEGKVLDTALVLPMRAPRSFTGDETVEIQCHGGYLVAKRILHALFSKQVRPANPGEFSFRAFLNGKMDLAQAEAIGDLIMAKNEEALRVAEDHLSGKLSCLIKRYQQQATDLAAFFEACVDFPEDDIEDESSSSICLDIQSLLSSVQNLADSFRHGKILHEGVSLCIVGAPNVGKSSLMNALLGKDRAIVSDEPGTTRDIVEDDLMVKGIHVHLIDTAGIRGDAGHIEREGIKRCRQAFARADIIVAVVDATSPNDEAMLQPLFEIPCEKSIVVWNKIDAAFGFIPTAPIPAPYIAVSAKTGDGIHILLETIESKVFTCGSVRREETLITNLRHKEALCSAGDGLKRVLEGFLQKISPEFLALEMRHVLVQFGSIIGTDITEDLLNSIFSRFCIGK